MFERNVARRYGGAIYFYTNPDCEMVGNVHLQFNVTVFANSVRISRNSAKFAGGGIFSECCAYAANSRPLLPYVSSGSALSFHSNSLENREIGYGADNASTGVEL